MEEDMDDDGDYTIKGDVIDKGDEGAESSDEESTGK